VTTVLVTGGAGFIGSNLADRLLAEDQRVVAVDDLSTGRIANLGEARGYGKAYTFFNMDVRADGLLPLFERHKPEVVFHLAAQAGVRPSLEDPVLDASVNLMGTLNVIECAIKVGVRKVIYAASGGTIYGEPRRIPAKESAAQGSHPLSPYGISKKAALDYLAFYQRYRGLDYTALALGNVFGPRQDPHGEAGVVAIFFGKLDAGETPLVFGDGLQTRDYVYVGDVVRANLAAHGYSGPEQVFNIGTGVETNVLELLQACQHAAGTAATPEHRPARLGELARSALDTARAERELGWRAEVGFAEGLQLTLAELRA
jgi:UDP-glucose 4-epimerase